ncbi:MAG: hypothetical protein F4Z29_04260 [Gemmatimonadetes bacterium]|nr:hypothetical protein [Gemmatimonadota bacterium]MXY96964.1 hypothetical protein [Gemmatimonadota bacterium]MYE93170.1 hypothetical protein [Gemmatimonadota bacterium]MYJ09882.1 hypothetical protein [Gemmatimonadota bacterium]
MSGRAWARAAAAIIGTCVLPAATLGQEPACETPWQLEETLRLGSASGEVTLSPVRALTTGPDGRIHLIQSWDHHVSVFTSAGRPEGWIGRAGSGPGEFASDPRRMGWRADTLWVSDRFVTQFFLADGTLVRQVSFRVPMTAEGSRFAPGTPLADGTFLPYRTVNEQAERFLLRQRAPLRRLSASGEIVDTIAMVERHLADYAIHRETDSRGFGMMLPHPLAPASGESWLPVVAVADGSAVVFIGEVRPGDEPPTFDLLRVGIAGDTLLHRTVPYVPLPVTRDERMLMRERFAAGRAGDFTPERLRPPWGLQDAERRRRIAREAITFPETHPPVRRILAGRDGSIWLLREAWPRPANVWEVYDAEGNREGSVRIGDPSSGDADYRPYVFQASRTELWAQTRSELDVPHVVRYEVLRGCPA